MNDNNSLFVVTKSIDYDSCIFLYCIQITTLLNKDRMVFLNSSSSNELYRCELLVGNGTHAEAYPNPHWELSFLPQTKASPSVVMIMEWADTLEVAIKAIFLLLKMALGNPQYWVKCTFRPTHNGWIKSVFECMYFLGKSLTTRTML